MFSNYDNLSSITLNKIIGRILIVLGLVVGIASCGVASKPPVSELKFDAGHSIALDGLISQGRLLTEATDEVTIKDEISDQLYYTVGILNGVGGVADLARTPREAITLLGRVERPDGKAEISYSAKLFIAWPRERALPQEVQLVVPADPSQGLMPFFDRYHVPECLDASAHDVSAGILWYYYRPFRSGCELNDATRDDPNLVSRFGMQVVQSAENTNGKYPEYAKVWEDGKVVVTAVFGKEQHGATAANDPGIAAYNQFYFQLLRDFGRPVWASTSVPRTGPGAAIPDVQMRFRIRGGELDVHLFVVDSIQSVTPEFNEKFNAHTARADFVSYSGHSGLGANIRALARKGNFMAGQYQIYMVNGCDTFAYVDEMLRQRHADVNPGHGPDKFFDMITNAMPSYFHMNAHANMTVIRALIARRDTYRQILGRFDVNQRAVVTGEQDNAWPAPF